MYIKCVGKKDCLYHGGGLFQTLIVGTLCSLMLLNLLFGCYVTILRAQSRVPVAKALVTAYGDEGYGYAITNVQGRYTISGGLLSGTYNVSVIAEGYLLSETANVHVVSGKETSGVNFFLKLSGGISGRVTDAASGKPLQQIVLMALPAWSNGTTGWQGITDSEGRYRIITNLATGMYNVTTIYPDGHMAKTIGPISVTAGVEVIGVDLALERSGTISGKVRSSTGTPIAGASVMAVSATSQFSGLAQTDANGNYKIASNLGTGIYTVYATYDSLLAVQQNVKVTQGQETSGVDFTITVAPSGSISGKVTDKDGKPIPRAFVAAEGPSGSGIAQTDANGNYLISRGLGTGKYTVTAEAAGYISSNVTEVSVTVGPPTRNIDLKLSPIPSEISGMISGIVEGESNPLLSRQPSAISCKTSATTVDLGSSITISGSISPVRVGVVVTISCSNDSAWVSLGTATSGLDGTYTYTWTPKSSGIYQLMASWEGDSTYAGAVSDAVSITVRSITTSPSPSSSTPTSKSGCLIATATYGSELSPQVQFLRIFRDRYVLQTFAGSSFMAVFNAVYYSFSPHIAALIYKSELLGWVMRILLYPLIAILLASYTVFELLSVSPELAVVTAGITASFLIGVVYLTPVTLLLFRLRRFRPLKNHILVSVIIWAISILATLISEVAGMSGLMMASTVSLVLATISVATLCTAKTLSRLPKTLTATLRFLR